MMGRPRRLAGILAAVAFLPEAANVAQNAKEQAILKAQDEIRRKQAAIDAAKKAKLDHDRQAQCEAAGQAMLTACEQ
jgi:hypothetical protein